MIYHYECYVECMLIILYIILRIVMTWYGPENTEKGPFSCYHDVMPDLMDILRIDMIPSTS